MMHYILLCGAAFGAGITVVDLAVKMFTGWEDRPKGAIDPTTAVWASFTAAWIVAGTAYAVWLAW